MLYSPKKFLEIAANLACGTDPSNTVVRTKIRSISNSIADSEPIIDMDKPSRDSLTITLVLKGEHYKYIDLASHNATKRISLSQVTGLMTYPKDLFMTD